jgi:hypothetical protein
MVLLALPHAFEEALYGAIKAAGFLGPLAAGFFGQIFGSISGHFS